MASTKRSLLGLIRLRSAHELTRSSARLFIYRPIHTTSRRSVVKPFLLADIGEGTTECQIIQWFVQPGARVEQFDKLCEVQSDKAATDITSPFDGVIKKLHYEPDDMAIVGKPLVDIDIQSEITPQDEEKLGGPAQSSTETASQQESQSETQRQPSKTVEDPDETKQQVSPQATPMSKAETERRTLATPAVRHLTKEHKLDIETIDGTGKDGRVTKEDVHRHISQSVEQQQATTSQSLPKPTRRHRREDKTIPLTPVQSAMFKTMTRSLSIPHFLYTMSVDMSKLTKLRERINHKRPSDQRLTPLPFILKAVSLAFHHHPLLNASLNTSNPSKPELTYRSSHNFGVAVDTPSGLLVPVIHDVQYQSVSEIASKIRSLSQIAQQGKLQQSDYQSGTFTVSNIGSIGGGVVAPIIVEPQVAIVGVGRSKIVPAFDERDELVRKEELVLSWSADHRVVDGAECARAAERVRGYLEDIESWILEAR